MYYAHEFDKLILDKETHYMIFNCKFKAQQQNKLKVDKKRKEKEDC